MNSTVTDVASDCSRLEVDRSRTKSALDREGKPQRYPYKTIADNEREHFWFIARNERISKLMKESMRDWPVASFLEIGAGTGQVLSHLSDQGFRNLTGWEIVEDGLAICQDRYPHIPISNTNFLDMARTDTRFDAIGMFDCLEHFPEDFTPLAKVRQLLMPGGKIILTVPAHQFLWTVMDEIFGHYRRYNKKQLKESLQMAGFTGIKMVYFMAALVPLAIVHRSKLRLPPDASEAEVQAIMIRETSLPLRPINAAMLAIARLEHKIMGMRDLNFGGSILAIATNPH